jgi:midasin
MVELVVLLEGCSVSLLASVAGKHLAGLRNLAPTARADDLELAAFLGEAWINAAYMLLELYFPEIPMDPLGGQTSQSLVWSLRAEWLHIYIHTLTLGQDLVHGANYEPTLDRLRGRLGVAQDQHKLLKPAVVRGPEHLQHLTEMFAETHTFLTQAVGHSRISQLMQSVKASAQTRDFLQEEMVQGTITTFLHRLHESYPDLADIILPLEYALHQLKLGLRMCASAAQRRLKNAGPVSRATQLLLQRPTVLGCQMLLEFDLAILVTTVPSSVSTAEWIIAKITALLLSYDIERTPRFPIHRLTELYDQFLHLWLSQKGREARAEEEGQSLYKQSKAEIAGFSEEDELEKEFSELFPSFDDVLDGPEVTGRSHVKAVRSAVSVSSADVRAIHQIHTAWTTLGFGNSPATPSTDSAYARTSKSITTQIAQDHQAVLDSSVDAEGFCQRVQVARVSLDSLAPKVNPSFDFYHDANIPELGKAARLLDAFRVRLDALIAEWPDQMVLRHLHERSQAISQLRLDTSLAKVLSALEQLLLNTDDWETYANKDNTLKVQQQQLADLIVDWRRLELKCWSTLLDREISSCVDAVSVWWPQLYESIVSVVASFEGDASKAASHLQELVPLLDSYFTQSPLGQFESRISLLRSFAKLVRCISTDSMLPSPFVAVSDLLDTLSLQYIEMLPAVQNSLAKQRAIVDKEISDFIKLASWKDTNVHALKQSAQKTHRALHKCIRKFRSIIRQPVSGIHALHTPNEMSPHEANQGDNASPRLPTSVITRVEVAPSSPLQNINIKLALQKYQLHATSSGRQLVQNFGTEMTRVLATRIASESKDLADTVVPDSEARERHIKALVSRKRRAWSDLLKELKRLGLAAAVTTDTLSQQKNRATLLLISLGVDASNVFSIAVTGANKQFIKLLEVMPDMRASFHQHHSDISTRDFQRASSLVESSFSIVIEARKT